ncbi:MAG TPA: hypothetical protein VJB97_04165 [Candidatus Paceibacterota bacterium]
MIKEVDDLERRRAETLYAAAVQSAHTGNMRISKGFAEECVLVLRRVGTDTQEECVARSARIGKVELPDFMHEEVVRQKLRSFGVNLEI